MANLKEFFTFEGVLFATGDARTVAKLYGCNALLVAAAARRVRERGPTLPQVWGGFLLYTLLRVVQFVGRFLWNQRDVYDVRRKRELPSLVFDLTAGKRRAAAPSSSESSRPVVWSTDVSYEARKYSAVDYEV